MATDGNTLSALLLSNSGLRTVCSPHVYIRAFGTRLAHGSLCYSAQLQPHLKVLGKLNSLSLAGLRTSWILV